MIRLDFLKDKHIAVLGLGRSGLSTALALQASGAGVLAWDDQEERRDHARSKGIECTDLHKTDLSGVIYLVISPGIAHTHPRPHPVAARAKQAGIPLVSDVELLRLADPDTDALGITGTNGKSTTTALVGHIMAHFLDIEVGGNIGRPVMECDSLQNRPHKGGQDDKESAYVLELSSYQLELTPTLKARGGIWLNLSPDHLERHGGLEGYIAAKQQIFASRPEGVVPVAVIGVDDEPSRRVADHLRKEGQWRVVPVSVDTRPDKGVYVEGGHLYDTAEGEVPVMDLGRVKRLKGLHNHQNAACAYALVRYVYGFPCEEIAQRIESFEGLPHRQYPVATINGVAYINDSKATNASATARALASFRNIYWIVGGEAKEGGLEGLDRFTDRMRHAFVIGEAAEDFAKWLDNHGVPNTRAETLDRALNEAHHMAQSERGRPGGTGVVLLSPACASFDQYQSFEHRGDHFATMVMKLKEDSGAE